MPPEWDVPTTLSSVASSESKSGQWCVQPSAAEPSLDRQERILAEHKDIEENRSVFVVLSHFDIITGQIRSTDTMYMCYSI